MRRRIRISKYTAMILAELGGAEYAINKMLELCENGDVEFTNKPAINASATENIVLNVNINNEYYLSLLKTCGEHNNNVSLARFVEWFCCEELYNEFDFEVRDISSRQITRVINLCNELTYTIGDKYFGKYQTDVIKLATALKEFYNSYEQKRNTENKNNTEDAGHR